MTPQLTSAPVAQEAVAWMVYEIDTHQLKRIVTVDPGDAGAFGCLKMPLYAAPQPTSTPVAQEPVAAQHRFRRPEKTCPDWSPWQPAQIDPVRKSLEIDSQGYEVEYRLLYTAPQPTSAQPAMSARDALLFAAQVIELYDDSTMREDNYMLSSTDCAGILVALTDYVSHHHIEGEE